jgi:crotonobetainyl-CoA:carnitine CoA-transferase CaiB-like acyl-CoA transferase
LQETLAVLDALTAAIVAQSEGKFSSNSVAPAVYYFAAILTALSEREKEQQPVKVSRSMLFILTHVCNARTRRKKIVAELALFCC